MSVQDTFKHNRARKNVIVGGLIIIIAVTIISSVSSFMIYKEGFSDMPRLFQNALALFAVITVEGTFIWSVYGFTRAFASFLERAIAFLTMNVIVAVMTTNIITHFMMVKRIPLHPFQYAWLSWGVVIVFIGALVFVLAITICDPVIRLIRLELRYLGKQQEIILEAKTEGLLSDRVQEAMATRAEWEAGQLADKIMMGGRHLPADRPAVIRGFTGENHPNHPIPRSQGQTFNYNYAPLKRDDGNDPKS